MASDQVVNSQDILQSLMQLRRLGTQRILKELEQQEPDLTEFLLEEHCAIHHRLMELGASPKSLRQLSRRIEAMAVVLVVALRQSHLRLWQQDQAPADPPFNNHAGEDSSPASKPTTPEQ